MGTATKAVFVSTHGSTGDIALLCRIAQAFQRHGNDIRLLWPAFAEKDNPVNPVTTVEQILTTQGHALVN